jgi:phage baseplate assembly protein V
MDANELHRLLRNLIRTGRVVDVDFNSKPPTCRVATGDSDTDGLQSNWVPWLTVAAGETREWLPISKGEKVVLLGPSGDLAQGIALRGLFSDALPAPDQSPRTHTRVYADGARISYDHSAHALTATLPAGATTRLAAPVSVTIETRSATLKADEVTLDSKRTTCTGALLVKGPLAFEAGLSGTGGDGQAAITIDGGAKFTEDVVAGEISLIGHPHRANGEFAVTTKPIPGAA